MGQRASAILTIPSDQEYMVGMREKLALICIDLSMVI